ncbi:hypothetical protein ECW26_44860 [Escherichia coli W26]|nr:hypothetical protein ECW26_44860 [Escherichia coli W26]
MIVAAVQCKNAVSGKWIAWAFVDHDSSFLNQPGMLADLFYSVAIRCCVRLVQVIATVTT